MCFDDLYFNFLESVVDSRRGLGTPGKSVSPKAPKAKPEMLETQWAWRVWKDAGLNIAWICWIAWNILDNCFIRLHVLPLESYFAIQSKIDLLVTIHFLECRKLPRATRICFRIMFFRVCTRPKEKVPVPIEQLGEQPSCTAAVLTWGVKSNVPISDICRWLFIHGFQQAEWRNFDCFSMSYTSQARQICEVGSQWNFGRGRTKVGDQNAWRAEMQSWHVQSNTFCILIVLIFLIPRWSKILVFKRLGKSLNVFVLSLCLEWFRPLAATSQPAGLDQFSHHILAQSVPLHDGSRNCPCLTSNSCLRPTHWSEWSRIHLEHTRSILNHLAWINVHGTKLRMSWV